MHVSLIAQPDDGVLPPNQNSIGLIVYNTALELAHSADVTLVHKARRGHHGARAVAGVQLEALRSPWDDRLVLGLARHPRWADRLRLRPLADSRIAYARSVAQALDRRPCRIAHVMNYWQWCTRLRRPNRAVVLEMQSEWLSQMNRSKVVRELAAADAVVAVSEHIARLFRQTFPEYGGLVAVAYNGVDPTTFSPDSGASSRGAGDRRSILFVGRMSPEKGVHVLLEAFARVAEQIPDATLDLVGPRTVLPHRFLVGLSDDPLVRELARFYRDDDSDYQRHLDELVSRHGLEDKVRFRGAVAHRELVSMYRSADVVVNPSFSESFGISIVEGMASGIPVIGTRVGGMLETIVDGDTGFLVDAGQADDLANAIVRVLEDRDLARRLGQSGRARVEQHFSWRARSERLMEVYRTLAGAAS